MSEQDLTRAIIQALTAKRIWCWRNNAGGTTIKDPKYGRRFIRMAPAGSPDIMGVFCDGKLFGLEVKIGKGKQSDSQKEWERKAYKHGAYYAVVRSVSDAISWLEAWGEIESGKGDMR